MPVSIPSSDPLYKLLPESCLLKNSNIIDTHNRNEYVADLRIKNGIICEIGANLTLNKNEQVFDLTGKYITSGFFDLHVHFREPGLEQAEDVISGCNAAMAGGFTGVAMMPNTTPAMDQIKLFNDLNSRGKSLLVDTYQIPAITTGREGKNIVKMEEFVKNGSLGFSDDGTGIQDSLTMKKALEIASELNVPLMVHSEDDSLKNGSINEGIISKKLNLPGISTLTEDIMIARDILISEYTEGKVHFQHVSTKGAVELIRKAKEKGLKITSEATPHHFSLDETKLLNLDTNFKMNPPLRAQDDVKAIQIGLKDGTIDAIATDHAPHTKESKQKNLENAPFGVIGLETAFGVGYKNLVQSKVLSFMEYLTKLNYYPRKILNLETNLVRTGIAANLVILDLNTKYVIKESSFKSKSSNSCFLGEELTAKAIGVINKNKIYIDGKL